MASPSPDRCGPLVAGRYAIRRKLGSGATGTVYLAQDTRRGHEVALKLIRADHGSSALTADMQEEFRASASLRHPQIAAAYDFGYTEDGGIPFYTRQYIEGSPLPPGPPHKGESPAEFLQPILDLLDALQYVHERGILHLDIHAGNLIVAVDQHRGALLIDFGLVRPIDTSRFSSRGTLSAMPPEMADGEFTPRTDLYLAGRLLLYHGGTPADRARRAAEACFSEAGAPLVLLLDDLDRADRNSRVLADALLEECARRARDETSLRGAAILVTTERPPPRRRLSRFVSRLRSLRAAEAKALLLALLRPALPPARLVRLTVAEARGLPLRVHRMAAALRQESRRHGSLDHLSELPGRLGSTGEACDWRSLPESDRTALEVLAVIGRAATRTEVAHALDVAPGDASRTLRRLVQMEAIVGHGRPLRYQLASPAGGDRRARVPRAKRRAIHSRLAAFLEQRSPTDPGDLENLARHLAALGRRGESRRVAVDAARRLRQSGSFERAIRVLEEAAALETNSRRRLRLLEELSPILEETGDHVRGIGVLEPFQSDAALTDRERIRVLRRLGIHYHRAGFPDRALAVFEQALEVAEPSRDLEDLAFIDTELAELHIIRGSLDAAEEACRRGLARLLGDRVESEFRARMEVMLRASLGHIALRRMHPRRARADLQASLKLARRFGTTSDRAAILQNLAVVANQLNELDTARRCFRRAQRLLVRAGNSHDTVKVVTNLAILAAKLGDTDEAREHLKLASRAARRYRGQSPEFFDAYSRGIVSLLLGEADAAVEALEAALPRGRRLGDGYLVRFGEVYLSEAYMLRGRHIKARKLLRATACHAVREGPALLVRMVYCRLFLVEALLGQSRAAMRARRPLEETERTDVVLVEAWNDLLAGAAHLLSGEESAPLFRASARVFGRLKIPFGLRYSRLGLLATSLADGDADEITARLHALEEAQADPHAFLSVAEAVARAAAFFTLGQSAAAADWLARASGAIVGAPCVELDWMIELLRARLAVRGGDAKEARTHLHRSLHSRGLMLDLLPKGARKSFLAHPRFAVLNDLASRLERTPSLAHSTGRTRHAGRFEGLIGQSSSMARIAQVIDRISDQDVPVLISGETGTGKELVATAIYRRSSRRRGAFQTFHCASLPEELFESELFGHRAGAFTGADEDRLGLLESLKRGTVLFDEVGDLSLKSQAKILRVLESGEVRPLGSERPVTLDVRFLFSSSRNLEELARARSFRSDLYYRIRGVEIDVPPLRERPADIPLLARHFLQKHAARLDRPAVFRPSTPRRFSWFALGRAPQHST